MYYSYIDDTFALFRDEQEAVRYFDQIESLYPSLRFSMVKENDWYLPFLDVLIVRYGDTFFSSVYRKPMFSGLYKE